jgi:hypothetical protein
MQMLDVRCWMLVQELSFGSARDIQPAVDVICITGVAVMHSAYGVTCADWLSYSDDDKRLQGDAGLVRERICGRHESSYYPYRAY